MHPRDSIFRWLWTYLRGWFAIAVLAFLFNLLRGTFSKLRPWLDPLLDKFGSGSVGIALAVVALIVVPWVLGDLARRSLSLFRSSGSGLRHI